MPAADAIGAVGKLNASEPKTEAAIEETQLVLLERPPVLLRLEAISRVPFTGTP